MGPGRARGARPGGAAGFRCASPPRHGGQGRAPEHPRRHDRRPGARRRRQDAERPAAPRRPGHDVRRRGRLLPPVLSVAGDLHHRPVRPQPWRGGQLLPLRLVRDEAPRERPPGVAAAGRLHDGAGRQVAQRLRRARRPRRGPGRLRHLARAPRRLRLRLLQLRDEPQRQAQVLGRRRVRAQARRVREHRGDAEPRGLAGRPRQAEFGVRPLPVPLLGSAESGGLLAGRDGSYH